MWISVLQLAVLGLYMATTARKVLVRIGREFPEIEFDYFQINVEGFPNPEDGHEPIFTAHSQEDVNTSRNNRNL